MLKFALDSLLQHEQDPEFVDGHHGPLTAEQKAECVARL
jgi:hypothetical protein